MDARETLKLISKQWCNLDDLMKLAKIGKNNAVKLLDKNEWTKDGRKWIFYDYVKNLDGSRRKYKSKKFFTKTEALKAEREFLTINSERSDKDRNMTFKDLYTLFYAYKEDKVKYTTLKTYRDREKFFKDLDNVKLKDFNIEHFENGKSK